jgi:acetylornithine deacetylase/succinyl-diaminopimelate desuccinylase-like protein
MLSFLSLNPLGLVPQLAAQRPVHEAFRWLHLRDGLLMDWQHDLTAIPAPPFGESRRAAWLLERFNSMGLTGTGIDPEGNVLGLLPAAEDAPPRAAVVLSAHLDTVFPAGTPIVPRRSGTRLAAPGACDNAAGVTGLLALAAAMLASGLRPQRPVLFVGNVGEEGEGDLRGMRYLYRDSPWKDRISAHLVLDGAGHEVAVTEALGSRRFLVTVTAPGGHSWTDAGAPNPIVILSSAIAALASTVPVDGPRTTLNVGTIEGGSSVNSIPERAHARFDLRSTSAEDLLALEVRLHRAVEDAVLAANSAPAAPAARRRTPQRAAFTIECIGQRPAGSLESAGGGPALYEDLLAVDRHLNIRTEPRVASTDANIPLSLGVPALGLGAGGDGGGVHTTAEWYDAAHRELALKRILLLTLLAAGREDRG